MYSILIADDEKNIRSSLEMILSSEPDYQIFLAADGAQAIQIIQNENIDLLILDLKMPVMDGYQVLKHLQDKDIIVIVISGFADVETAVQAMKYGAYDFIEKPLSKEKILVNIRNSLESRSIKQENKQLKETVSSQYVMIYSDQKMQKLVQEVEKIAPTNATVLICGESGTGKEAFANLIHEKSKRSSYPFVKVNCAAIPESLIESELFGFEKGSFTNAYKARKGKFELAHRGTLFLDEIGEMSLSTQVKILRVLQEGEFERIGGEKGIRVDVRLVVATNKNLAQEVREGRFREDLFYRINVINFQIPPLRQRYSDIPLIIDFYIDKFCRDYGLPEKKVSSHVYNELSAYSWPGNVRELRNLIERLVIITEGNIINASGLEKHVAASVSESKVESEVISFKSEKIVPLRDFRAKTEEEYIIHVLNLTQWNITQASEILGIERTYLHRKIKAYNLKKITSTQIEKETEFD
ncbi:MAG: sigma-54-dependent Fis family transcriptional regulator [Candidatus Coatesbacteria bacterium]|nr:sigma-54-dependent Fis family transcriptional regulator [Candidatus Coatesbacteria bacterium]